jgi:hypothetical protein
MLRDPEGTVMTKCVGDQMPEELSEPATEEKDQESCRRYTRGVASHGTFRSRVHVSRSGASCTFRWEPAGLKVSVARVTR